LPPRPGAARRFTSHVVAVPAAGSDNEFWSYEWSKHGTCALSLFPDESAYFGAALALNGQYDINAALAGGGIDPLTATGIQLQSQLLPILQDAWGVAPQVICLSGDVFEVRLCISPEDLTAIDCPRPGGSCSSRNRLGLPYGGPAPEACAAYYDGLNSDSSGTTDATSTPRPPPPPPSAARAVGAAAAAAAAALAGLAAVLL
jgi:ribonuclease T2